MPEKKTIERAEEDLREGKRPTTAAGEFVKEEMEHIREGKHGARSTKQAIAIGLSKARRAGVPLKPPKKGQTSERTRKSAERAYETGRGSIRVRGETDGPHRARPHRRYVHQRRVHADQDDGRERPDRAPQSARR